MYYSNQFYRISSPSQLIYDVVVNMLNNIDKLECAVCSRVLVPTTYNKSKTFFSKLEAKILEGHLDGQVSQTSTNSLNFEVLHCPNNCSYYLVQNNIDQRPRQIKYSSSFIIKHLNKLIERNIILWKSQSAQNVEGRQKEEELPQGKGS